MELLVIPAVLVFYFLFRVFVSVGDHSTPKMHAPRVDKWGNHLRALDMDQPEYLRSHDEEYKQYPQVDGETVVYDGEVVEQERNWKGQLKSGR